MREEPRLLPRVGIEENSAWAKEGNFSLQQFRVVWLLFDEAERPVHASGEKPAIDTVSFYDNT